MSRPVAVLRPEPGNSATADRLTERGVTAIRLPLFAVKGLPWEAPDPAAFDALIITSANTVRHGGASLATLRSLPVLAVGAATADAVRDAGFAVLATGSGNAQALIDQAEQYGISRALHLGGREAMVTAGGIIARTITVYASEAQPIPVAAVRALAGCIALLHSARAAARLAALVDEAGINRHQMAVVAISAPVADTAGPGWARVDITPTPTDAALIDLAITIARDP